VSRLGSSRSASTINRAEDFAWHCRFYDEPTSGNLSPPVFVAGNYQWGKTMDITALIIQLIVGAIGGNAAGAAMKNYSLGTLGNTIAGVVGGGVGGQILNSILGGGAAADAAAAASGMDIGAIIQQVAGGGIGGAILMIIVGIIKNAMNKG
jgi:hypothetical protein